LGDAATKIFVYDVGNVTSLNAPQLYNCGLDGSSAGAPAILAGATERALVADNGAHELWAFAKNAVSNVCSSANAVTNSGGNWTGTINPPTTDGTNVFLGHDTSKLAKVPFSSGAFGTVTEAGSFAIPIFGPVSLAGSLYFGDRNALPKLYSYDASALTITWTIATTLGDVLNAPVVVGPTFAFGAPASGDGHLNAFNKSDGTPAFTWQIAAGTKIGNISAPVFGADGTIYFADDGNKELVPLTLTGTTPALNASWSSSFKGSATQTTTGGATTVVDALGTEPTIDSNGVLYFATGLAKVYAIITDSGGPLPPAAGSTWPRVGYDNC